MKKNVFKYRINLLLYALILSAPFHLFAEEGFNPLQFGKNRAQLQQDPFALIVDTTGNKIRIDLRLRSGYGIKRDERQSYVSVVYTDAGGKRHVLKKKNFSGKIAAEDSNYFSSVRPFSIALNSRFFANSKLKFFLSYCSFGQGICFQKEIVRKIQN